MSVRWICARATPKAAPVDAHKLDAQERAILVRVLQETHFNRSAAASRLGLSLRQMRYRIARLNIALPQNDDSPPEHETEDF